MKILGISCFYHDAAACLLKDGKIIAAAAEERFSRQKHDNDFPKNAIDYCLRALNIAANELDLVVFYEKPVTKFERILYQHLEHFPKSRKTFVDTIGSWYGRKLQIKKLLRDEFHYLGKVYFVKHHLSHAASAYYLSNFDEATIVTADGVGEWATTTMGRAEGKRISLDREIRFPHSLGLLYSAITAYLGFKVNNDEYKVMGLAAYGDPKPFAPIFKKLLKTYKDGSFSLNMRYFNFTWSERMVGEEMEELFGFKVRKHDDPVEKHHEDAAAALQKAFEGAMFNLLEAAYKKYKIKNLCLAGGVTLNSVFNGKILQNTPYKNVFIPPDPGDGGGAMGAALYAHNLFSKDKKNRYEKFSPYLGPGYSNLEIENVLKKYKLKYEYFKSEKRLIDKVSDLIIEEQIIGWFQGRMEWGPRALGARSILASAAREEMKDIINARVKHREMFRPFAPVILEERVHDYFVADRKVPPSAKYMLMVYPFKERGKKKVPAVVHVDGSGRLQTIARKDNPLYYDLVATYGQKTGTPIILNTSFNRREPIVCTPEDAVKTFLSSDIDYLVAGSYLVRNPAKND